MANLSNINNILRVSSSGVGLNKNNTGPSELDIESSGADMIDMTRTGQKTYRFAISGASAFSLFDVAANADRLIIDSSGNVEIGANYTNAKLSVGGNLAILNTKQLNLTGTLDSDLLWYGMRYDNNEVQIYTYYPSDRSITFNTVSGGTGITTQLMKIETGGNVGIGTDSPTSIASGYTSVTTNGTNGGGLVMQVNGTATGYLYAESGALVLNNTSGVMQFYNAGSERMRINSSGQLLIETTTSQTTAKLGVRQNGSAIEFGHDNQSVGYYGTLGATYSSGNPFIAFRCFNNQTIGGNNFATQGHKGNVIFSESNGDLVFGQATTTTSSSQPLTERMRIDSSGLVSIKNVGVPTLRLENTDTSLGVQTLGSLEYYQSDPSATGVGVVSRINSVNESGFQGAAALTFETGDVASITERMRINSSGNVGINDTNPNTANLSIKGQSSGVSANFPMLKLLGQNTSSDGLHITTTGTGNNYYAIKVATGANSSAFNVTNAGNVGIGTDSPQQKLCIETNAVTSNPEYIEFTDAGSGSSWVSGQDYGGMQWFMGDGTGIGAHTVAQIKAQNEHTGAAGSAAIVFSTAPYNTVMSERMRISSTGVVGIGDTNPTLATRLVIAGSSGSGNVCDIRTGSTANTNIGAIVFRNSASAYCGQITVNGATAVTSYLSASDYRLKEDLKDFKGLDLVSNIKVYDYKWKSADERTYGVVAHELQEVLPQAVDGNKDDEQMQGVDYSKIVPLLVKSIQELKADNDSLKARIETLENK